MPYIPLSARHTAAKDPATTGELNYAITQLLIKYADTHGNSYDTFNAIQGALNCVGFEFYRRVMAPYEDKKRSENGDVY